MRIYGYKIEKIRVIYTPIVLHSVLIINYLLILRAKSPTLLVTQHWQLWECSHPKQRAPAPYASVLFVPSVYQFLLLVTLLFRLSLLLKIIKVLLIQIGQCLLN